jgi:hypothetical protein
MQEKKYILIGRALDEDALEDFVDEAKFSLRRSPVSSSAKPSDLIEDRMLICADPKRRKPQGSSETFGDRLALLGGNVYQGKRGRCAAPSGAAPTAP